MPDNEQNLTEEERAERIRRARKRKALKKKRAKRRKIIKMAKIGLIAIAALIVLILVISAIRKVVTSRAQRAAAAAEQAEIEKTMETWPAENVLHLSFPVLTIDEKDIAMQEANAAKAEGTAETEQIDITKDTDGDGIPDYMDADADGDGITDEGAVDADNDGYLDEIPDVSSLMQTEETEEENSEETETADGEPKPTAESLPLTVPQFRNILQDLYDRGYVLINIYGLNGSNKEGLFPAEVMVPIGKKPLIISEENLAYEPGFDGRADQMVIGDDGKVTCLYTSEDGTVKSGDVDVIPCVETFIAEHPDFSVNGARGVIGISGDKGLMGYTDSVNSKQVGGISQEAAEEARKASGVPEGMTTVTAENEAANTDSTSEETDGGEETESAAKPAAETKAGDTAASTSMKDAEPVITLLRSSGWHFASAGYGTTSYASSYDLVKKDAEQWQESIGTILGTTDILMLPAGADIDGWTVYHDNNKKYIYLRSTGFRYYCVENDAAFTWLQVGNAYVRQGIHKIDTREAYDRDMALGA